MNSLRDSSAPQTRRNAEIFVRHCAGDSYATLAKAYRVSRARAGKIGKQAAERLICGLPITVEPSSENYAILSRRKEAAK